MTNPIAKLFFYVKLEGWSPLRCFIDKNRTYTTHWIGDFESFGKKKKNAKPIYKTVGIALSREWCWYIALRDKASSEDIDIDIDIDI